MPPEAERLLAPHREMNEMADLNPRHEGDEGLSRPETRYTDDQSRADISGISSSQLPFVEVNEERAVYRVYKRRWFGLFQLVLLNIVVSWDVSISNFTYQTEGNISANLLTKVVILLGRRRHSCDLLLHHHEYHKLVKHLLPLRLRRRCPSHSLHSPHRWSTTRNHHVLALYPRRQLAPLRWHTLLPALLPLDHDRPNPDRARPAFCPLRTDSVLGSLVFTQRPCLGHRARLACQSVRRRPWPADQPFPCPQPGLDPEHDPICCIDLVRRHHSLILHTFETPHALLALLGASPPLDPTHSQPPLIQPDLLPSPPLVCHLRRSLQFDLLPSHSDILALWILRQRIRHRRRAADPRRPGVGRGQLAGDRPVQGLPSLHQDRRARHRAVLSCLHLGAADPQPRGAVRHPQRAGSSQLQPPARRARVVGRGDVPRRARGQQHHHLGRGPAVGRHLHRDQRRAQGGRDRRSPLSHAQGANLPGRRGHGRRAGRSRLGLGRRRRSEGAVGDRQRDAGGGGGELVQCRALCVWGKKKKEESVNYWVGRADH